VSDAPDLGLLLDVDGPIASPVSRTIAIPTIIDDLIALTAAGVPIAFVTGRSDAFIDAQVVAPLMAHGLADALRVPGARMFGVFEKGAVWAPIDEHGLGDITVDDSVAFRPEDIAAIRELAEGTYGDTMFFDETKRAMISVEQRTDVDSARYYAAQSAFQNDAYALLTGRGVGLRYGDREQADATGAVPFRVDPTVISTDIESVLLDKDRGAVRALEHFARRGPLPRTWRSVGDSRSDYKMADQLHADGFEVAHVDVRPSDGVLDKPYPVIVEGELIHDEAGAAFLRHWRTRFGL
jgi:phosphoglycolate phosphatase-like HAD superfamily hydrolase